MNRENKSQVSILDRGRTFHHTQNVPNRYQKIFPGWK